MNLFDINIDLNLVVLIALAFILTLYVIFSFLVLQQVRILNKAIKTNFSLILDALALLEFITGAIALGIVVLLILV